MILRKVTITGADDMTATPDLAALAGRYPFLEWGVLVSDKRYGTCRYPKSDWINRLIGRVGPSRVSIHVCGYMLRQMLMGMPYWYHYFGLDLREIVQAGARMQFNVGSQPHVMVMQAFNALAEWSGTGEFIFQLNGANDFIAHAARNILGWRVSGLLDRSGGLGLTPINGWAKPHQHLPTGFAGGLGPDNIIEQLNTIDNICPWDYQTWIDMETHVRSKSDQMILDWPDILDIGKVEAVAQAVSSVRQRFIIKTNDALEATV